MTADNVAQAFWVFKIWITKKMGHNMGHFIGTITLKHGNIWRMQGKKDKPKQKQASLYLSSEKKICW